MTMKDARHWFRSARWWLKHIQWCKKNMSDYETLDRDIQHALELCQWARDELRKVQRKNTPYGQLGNRPFNCEDPDNPKHICYKDCL